MNDKETTYHLIERYLNNELSTDERILFESRIESEPDLANQLKEIQEANELLLDKFLLEEKEMMRKFDYKSSTNTRDTSSKWWLSGLILLLGISSAILFYPSTDDEEKQVTGQTILKIDDNETKKLEPSKKERQLPVRKKKKESTDFF